MLREICKCYSLYLGIKSEYLYAEYFILFLKNLEIKITPLRLIRYKIAILRSNLFLLLVMMITAECFYIRRSSKLIYLLQ